MTEQLKIAPLTAAQQKAVCRLADLQLGAGYLGHGEFSRHGLHTLVASRSSEVVGFITYEVMATMSLQQAEPRLFAALPEEFQAAEQVGKIGSLAVDHNLQGQGIGRRLMTIALDDLADQVRQVFLLAWRSQTGVNVQPLAEKLGFTAVAELADYWKTDSLDSGYACPVCGVPPCRCSVVIFCQTL